MKISPSNYFFGLVLIFTAISLGYSLHTSARVRELEQRLQHAEGALQAENQPFGRITSLEKRVRQLELAPAKPMFISSGSRPADVDRQVSNIAKKVETRPEPLPPY